MNMQKKPEIQFLKGVEARLVSDGASEAVLLQILDSLLDQLDCVTGTIHSLDPKSGLLVLRAERGLPAMLLDKVARIPIGKGMAGLAAERKAPVQICNLQTDSSGVAKPGAKETKMQGSIAVPMLVGNTILRGVLGVAKPVAYEFAESEQSLLLQTGALIGSFLGPQTRQQVLDQYFIEIRAKLIEVAAFLDRVDRAEGDADYRLQAFREAIKALEQSNSERAKSILTTFSDPTTEPIAAAKGKSATGAWAGRDLLQP